MYQDCSVTGSTHKLLPQRVRIANVPPTWKSRNCVIARTNEMRTTAVLFSFIAALVLIVFARAGGRERFGLGTADNSKKHPESGDRSTADRAPVLSVSFSVLDHFCFPTSGQAVITWSQVSVVPSPPLY